MWSKFLMVIVGLSIFIIFLFFFLFSKPVDKILSEIEKLNPKETVKSIITQAECKSLEKYDNILVVKDCKDEIYFKFFLYPDGYIFGYCTSWSTPREAFFKLQNYLRKSCLNESSEDVLLDERGEDKIYRICGLKLFFKGECILG